jgi:Rod binding domain-containing protein
MLPPISNDLLPADVRDAGPKARALYDAALSFEQTLVRQLTQGLTSALQGGSDDDSGDATSSMYTEMLPDALAQGITNGGGLGLADDLYGTMSARYGVGGKTDGSAR